MKLLDKLWSGLGLVETEEADLQAVPEKPAGRAEHKMERKQERVVMPSPPKPQVKLSPVAVTSAIAPNVSAISVNSIASGTAVVISHPIGFDDARQIADHVTNKRMVVVNFAKTDSETTKRTVDFMSGITYALGGGVQRIAGNIFLFAPDRVDIIFADNMNEADSGPMSWNRL